MKVFITSNFSIVKRYRKILLVLGWLLGAGIFLFQIYSGFRGIATSKVIMPINGLLLIALFMPFISIWFQMAAWKILMEDLGVTLGWNEVLLGYLLSFLPRYIPGTIWGYLSRNEWLFQNHGVDYEITNLGSGLELASAITANICVIGLAFVTKILPIWLFGIFAAIFIPSIWWLLRSGGRFLQSQFHLEMKWLKTLTLIHLKVWVISTLLFVATWFLYGISLGLISLDLRGFHQIVTPLWILDYAGFYSIAWLVGFLILFVPAGLGFRELMLTGLLINQMSYPGELANTISILSRLLILCAELIWLLPGFLLRAFIKKIIK